MFKKARQMGQRAAAATYDYVDGTLVKITVGGTALVAATPSFAVAPATLADLTTGISFADVSLGILAVAGLMIGVYVVKKGVSDLPPKNRLPMVT